MASTRNAVATRDQNAPAPQPTESGNSRRKVMTIREARGFLSSDAVMEQLAMAAAKGMEPDRLVRVALVAMAKQPKLLTCTTESIALALMEAGSLGLAPTGVLGEAYLVPYWNNSKRQNEAQLQIGYRGLVKLARRSGTVFNVQADVVREGDFFEWEKGLAPKLLHRPAASGNRGDLTHAYAVAWVKDGPAPFDVMDAEEIEAIRSRSKAKDSGPWVTDYFEMAKKTVIRRLSKSLDLSPEAEAAIAHDDGVEYGTTHGAASRLAYTMVRGALDRLPEPEQDDPQARSNALANRLSAGAPNEDEAADQPLTPGEEIQLEQALAKAVELNVLTIDESAEFERLQEEQDFRQVRENLRDLQRRILLHTEGEQAGLPV